MAESLSQRRKVAPGEYIYLLLYVDDMLISCKSKAEIGSTKFLLKREFDMKDLGYLVNPGKNHWEAVKWILKYLRGTANVGLIYGTNRGNHKDVIGFVDSDYAKDPDKGRYITGYAFLVQGCVVSWKKTLQHVMALSTTEAEYMAFTEAVKETIWLKGLLEELGVELNRVTVNCDNQGAIHLSRNHVFHERTKHINVRYHFIREVLEAKTCGCLDEGGTWTQVTTLLGVAECCHRVLVGYYYLPLIFIKGGEGE
nr:retrovirus-related Pol polyprotein from transposon TNT 1-94 [Tanacetum cinerariifolium]